MGCQVTPHVLMRATVHAWDFFNIGVAYFNSGALLLFTLIAAIIMAKYSSRFAASLSQSKTEYVTRSWIAIAFLGYLGIFFAIHRYYSKRNCYPDWWLLGLQVFIVELLTNILLLSVVCLVAGKEAVEVRFLEWRIEKAKEDRKAKEGKVMETEDDDLVLIAKE